MGSQGRCPMRVCFSSAREPSFHRNKAVLRALQDLGHDVSIRSSFASNYAVRIPSSLMSLLGSSDYDLLFLGFLGHPHALLARSFTGTKIILDGFVSPYDTLCLDRKTLSAESVVGKLLQKIEGTGYGRVDRILFDTKTHAEYIAREFSLPADKVSHLYVSADETVFHPSVQPNLNGGCHVVWYGSFLPLHGVHTIMDAMERVSSDAGLNFTIVGRGIESPAFVRWLKQANHPRTTYIPWLPLRELGELVAGADVLLGGHYGDIEKARRVIPTKAIEGAAAGKALILGNNPANKEIFQPSRDAAFVEMADGEALADAIRELADSKHHREELGKNAHRAYLRTSSRQTTAKNLNSIISDVEMD